MSNASSESGQDGPHRHVVAVDVVCMTVHRQKLCVELVTRDRPPFVGMLALPGSTVRKDETLTRAANRVVDEQAWLPVGYLEQLYTFDGVADPRGPRISVAFYMIVPDNPSWHTGSQSREWWPVDSLPPLPFDHALIVHYARNRITQKLLYTPIAFRLLPETFTISDLKAIHDAITGSTYKHLPNFQTLMLRRWSLQRTDQFSHRTKRPARLYRYIGPHEVAGLPPERTQDGT